jgi:hypothetical protein
MRKFFRMPAKGLYSSAPGDVIGPEYAIEAVNVRFRFSRVTNRPGTTNIQNVSTTPLGFYRFFTDTVGLGVTTKFTLMLTDTSLFKLVGAVWVQITTLTNTGVPGNIGGSGASPLNRFSVAMGENKFFFTRKGMENIQYWDGVAATTVRTIDSSGTRGFPGNIVPGARHIEYFNNRLLAGYTNNPTENSTIIIFSGNGNTQNWNVTPLIGGGFIDSNNGVLGEESFEPMTGLKALASRCAIYKRHAIMDLIPTGSTPIFTTETRIRGIGCAASHTLMAAGQTHYFLGEDNVYAWDGIQIRSIGDAIQRDFINLIDTTLFDSYFAAITVDRQEYYLSMTNGIFFVYDYLVDAWNNDRYPSTGTVHVSALGNADRATLVVIWIGVGGIQGSWLEHGEAWSSLNTLGFPALLGGGPRDGTFGTFYFDPFSAIDYTGANGVAAGAEIECRLISKRFYFDEEDPFTTMILQRVLFKYGEGNENLTMITAQGTLSSNGPFQSQSITPNNDSLYSYADFNLTGSPVTIGFITTGGIFSWESFMLEMQDGGQLLP